MPLCLAKLIASHIPVHCCQHSALEASKHVFLAAMLWTDTLSHAFCREFSALEESRQLWLAMMKACRVRGPAGEPGLYMCARSLAITLSSIAEGKFQQSKCGEAEILCREALLVILFACRCFCTFLLFFHSFFIFLSFLLSFFHL